MDLNIPMVSAVPYGLLPDYYNPLGKDAEFVYSGSFCDAALPYSGNSKTTRDRLLLRQLGASERDAQAKEIPSG